MGEVIRFPNSKPKSSRPRSPGKRAPWAFADLCGKRPRKHPAVEYGPKGRVMLAVGQVWVERHTQHLYIVKELRADRKGFYPYTVTYAKYGRRCPYREQVCEATFRMCFEVWDSFAESQKVLMLKLEQCGGSQAHRFFGLDKQGNRVE